MRKEPITPASLSAFLAVHTAVPMMLGRLEQKTPWVGTMLTEDQRLRLGLSPGGNTLVYDIDESHVVMDLAGNTATISFMKGDVQTAIGTFDRILKRDLPQLKQTEDVVHPRGGRRRLRVYAGDVEPKLHCQIEAEYPNRDAAGADAKFVARVSAFTRTPEAWGA